MTTPVTITIPAAGANPGAYNFRAKGRYFLLTATTGTFTVITNKQETYQFSETGSGFGDPKSPVFGSLNFYNNSGAAVTITFYVSLWPIKTADVTVESSVTVNAQLTNTLAGCAAATQNDMVANAAVLNTANAFTGTSTPFRKCTLVAFKSFGTPGNAPGANTGNVFIGVTAAHQPIQLEPGDFWTFEAPTGAKYDLSNFYISAPNAGDGVLVIYA